MNEGLKEINEMMIAHLRHLADALEAGDVELIKNLETTEKIGGEQKELMFGSIRRARKNYDGEDIDTIRLVINVKHGPNYTPLVSKLEQRFLAEAEDDTVTF